MSSITQKVKEKEKQKEKIAFFKRLHKFIEFTRTEVDRGINPGGYYKAVWTRDAAFILRDQFLSGYHKIALEQILLIWSNQIHSTTTTGRETSSSPSLLDSNLKRKPLLYGRGSPEMNFNPIVADEDTTTKFDGALPTTIYNEKNKSFCEVYAQNPDIDSTALMISTTSYILSNFLDLKDIYANKETEFSFTLPVNKNIDNEIEYKTQFSELSLNDIITLLIPPMLKALKYLQNRDIDNDGLLEQKHNEDWMDTTLRIGKVVYSQACWILALKNFLVLLKKLGKKTEETKMIESMINRTIIAVESKMWSKKDGSYIDLLDADLHLDKKMHNRLVTQDISLYLVALTEKETSKDNKFAENNINIIDYPSTSEFYNNFINLDLVFQHAVSTLDVLKKRIWKNNLPLVTETEITKTGPWLLEPNEYHNHTFWLWITGIEMLARTRFGKIDDCNLLLSNIISNNNVHSNMLHEWVHPLTLQGRGAYPFRTGISSMRITAMEFLSHIESNTIRSSIG